MRGEETHAVLPFDPLLISRIQEGQAEAEAELYDRFSDRVYHLGLRMTRSRADAEDIRAETFLRVLSAIRANRLRSASSLVAYILGTARNVLREFARQRQPGDLDPAAGPEPSTLSQEGMFIDSDVREAIKQAIARLKPRERELLRMHYYEELPRAEIARRSGIAEDRIRLVKSRALKRFRDVYTKIGGINNSEIRRY